MTTTRRLTTVREINLLTRDGGNGLNVYLRMGDTFSVRITKARMRDGVMEVKTLYGGTWYPVLDSHTIEASL